MAELAESTLVAGALFQGGYEIVDTIYDGPAGLVYKGRQLSTGQDVAIKVLRVGRDGDVETQRARFRREMRLCAGLSHPNIVRLLDSGEASDGMLYAVFEHVPGTTLRDLLKTDGKLAVPEAVHLMTQVLDALACAHARGVVHRDLKPENIMVSRTGVRRNALVLDFGLGGFTRDAADWALPKITATHELMGTPCYAAPEQLRGEPPSTRGDLYSWGLVFLECLTGELVVHGGSGHEVLWKQLGPEPVPIPPWLRRQRLGRLLEIVTAKSAEKRDVTIEGLLEALATVPVPDGTSFGTHAPAAALPDGERRQLTIVSCRLAVAPTEPRPIDPEEIDETIHAQHALFAELAARARGQMAGVLADRAVLVFGYPRAREDDARRAVRTALAIAEETARAARRLEEDRRLRVDVRIGVHTGIVVVRELRQATYQGPYDLVGATPETAARLDERAGPGEVLISAETHRLLRGDVPAEPAGELPRGPVAPRLSVFRARAASAAATDTHAWTRETPLVGRTGELRQLTAVWRDVQAGRPSSVLLRGEPGIGKSRLVRELRRRVPPDGWLEARCVAENQASPLRPFVDLILGAREPVERLLARLGFDLAETLPLFMRLLSRPLPAGYAPLALSAEREKELTIRALLDVFLRLARERPLVLALEDLHWADPTTIDLTGLLVQEIAAARVVGADPAPRLALVVTARPDLVVPWSLDEVASIPLSRLPRADVEEMVAVGLATGRALPRPLVDKIVVHSDGIPLFVEEVTHVLLESGARDDPAPALDIPTTLRDLLAARVDRLSLSAKDTMQHAAVIGREFRYEVLSAVAQRDEPLLREDLHELIDAGLLFARRGMRSEGYVFKHALLRDTAYESMSRRRRRDLHRRVARTIAQRFPDVAQHQPELLAQHFEHGDEPATAAGYWNRAGERALGRAAYVEAIGQLERGLAALATLPASPAKTRQEIELLTTLGTAFISTKGYAAEEVERTFARAGELCEELGEDTPLKVLGGLAGLHLSRGDRERITPFLPRLRQLARRGDDPVAAMSGHQLLGIHAFWSGDFPAAHEHACAGMRLYDTTEVREFAWEYGYGLFCHAYAMCSLWHLGLPDQAAALRSEALRIAEESRNAYSILVVLGFAVPLSHDRGDTEDALAGAERLISFATEQRLYLWLALGMCGRGGTHLLRGDPEAAIGDVKQGLDLYRVIGLRSSYSYYLTYLAEACLAAGKLDDGLAAVHEGLGLCETSVARFHEPELWRLRGELLARRQDACPAEEAFRQAIRLAQRGRGRGLELRAATSLAALLADTGRRDEARSALAAVYAGFDEGLGTRDLRAARTVLDRIG